MKTVKIFYKVALLFFTLVVGTACAVKNVDDSYTLESDSNNGLIVLSLSVTGSDSVYLAYRKIGAEEQGEIYVDSYGVKGIRANYDWKDPVGRLVYIELGAGEYEFYGWHPKYCGWDTECAPLYEPIRFSVTQGAAYYLGNIHFSILRYDQAYKYEVRDEFERDIALLATRLSNVPGSQVVKMLLTSPQ